MDVEAAEYARVCNLEKGLLDDDAVLEMLDMDVDAAEYARVCNWEKGVLADDDAVLEMLLNEDENAVCTGDDGLLDDEAIFEMVVNEDEEVKMMENNFDHPEAVDIEILRNRDVAKAESLDRLYEDAFLRQVLTMPQGVRAEDMLPEHVAFLITMSILLLNNHKAKHAKSCFKPSVRTRFLNTRLRVVCRYLIPRMRVSETKFEKGVLLLKRLLGSEYINGYNYVLTLCLRCNHDIQLTLGGMNSAVNITYSFKYHIKLIQSVESRAAIALAALARRRQREQESTEPLTTEQISRRRQAALMISTTGKFEMGLPMACLYILRDSRFYFSVDFASIHLAQLLAIYNGQPYERRIQRRPGVDRSDDETIRMPSSDTRVHAGDSGNRSSASTSSASNANTIGANTDRYEY
jgi:hypothetical protein